VAFSSLLVAGARNIAMAAAAVTKAAIRARKRVFMSMGSVPILMPDDAMSVHPRWVVAPK
jgi:hypothetical protein